ncbi:MAG: thiamine phosphate synthase [Rhizobiales bacterium PAR1]|nr:MAG: thiamine phosphate synthase [Rhizobiales bacterium PAR1]
MPRPDIRFYGILDADRLAGLDLPALAVASVKGGVTILQLRDKTGSTRRMIDTARGIRNALNGAAPLLINDRVDVALASGAEGVHLGREDMAPAEARGILGKGPIIGVTIKNEADLAALDPTLVDYGCIGGVFATTSKQNPDPPVGLHGLAHLRQLAAKSGLPVGAIAGIELANTAPCIGAGADGVALISALYLTADVESTARAFRAAIDSALAARGAA